MLHKAARPPLLNATLFFFSAFLQATTTVTSAHAERFHVSGNVLHFDMGYRGSEQEYSRELEQTDVLAFLDILFENPVIDI
jgi:hypothetical protein